jgi:hypothetical protein
MMQVAAIATIMRYMVISSLLRYLSTALNTIPSANAFFSKTSSSQAPARGKLNFNDHHAAALAVKNINKPSKIF